MTEPKKKRSDLSAEAEAALAVLTTPAAGADLKEGGSQSNIHIYLRKIPLLANLTDEEMLRVRADLRVREYARRDVVMQKGGAGDSLLLLLSGQLQVIDISADGRVIGLRTLSPGEFFGEIAVINGSVRSASLVAMTPVLVALLPRNTALQLFSNSPQVANHMLRFLAEKVQRDSQFRALLSINNTARRIYAYIDLLKETAAGGIHVVENLPTHQDIANMINTSRETVTRTLLLLAQQGIVKKGTHRLIIVDPDALRKLAHG